METKSLTNSTKVATKKPHQKKFREEIPKQLDINNVYNPKYDVIQLMSTRRKLCVSKNPPRPPNSYFLMKNCYMLELRAIGFARIMYPIKATVERSTERSERSLRRHTVKSSKYPQRNVPGI